MSLNMASNVGAAQRLCALYRSATILVSGDPTTSVALDNTSERFAMDILPASANGWYLLGGEFAPIAQAGQTIFVCDFLVVSGQLNASLTTEQTTNLPSAALPRYTSGEGVVAALIIFGAPGATATTFTVSYTNQSGTSGRTSTAQQIGGTGFREIGRIINIPLQQGDTGIRSVESVTLLATTGAAGDFGVLLYKPLAAFAVDTTDLVKPFDCISTGGMGGKFAKIEPTACISLLGYSNAQQFVNGTIFLGQA